MKTWLPIYASHTECARQALYRSKTKDQISYIKDQRSLAGKTIDFKYYVMDLIWMSLKDAKRMCGDDFK